LLKNWKIFPQKIFLWANQITKETTRIKMSLKKTIKNSWILLCMAIWIFSTNCTANPEPQFVHGVNPYVNTGINTGTSFEV
jgi:hypothetical protein